MSYDGDDSYPHDGKQGRCSSGKGTTGQMMS